MIVTVTVSVLSDHRSVSLGTCTCEIEIKKYAISRQEKPYCPDITRMIAGMRELKLGHFSASELKLQIGIKETCLKHFEPQSNIIVCVVLNRISLFLIN